MERQEYTKYLIEAFNKNGLHELIDEEKAEKLFDLYNILAETNKVMNLTAITDEKEVILKHFIDSATVCALIDGDLNVVDVGCGAGFPSLPLAILRPDLTVTAIDSTGKRVNFVNETVKKLSLSNVTAICARAEDFAKNYRESFDVCTSRAVARLNVLAELCVPLVKIGGSFVPMKSERGEEELSEAQSCISKLGCKLALRKQLSLSLDTWAIQREIFVFNKTSRTPIQYPRNYSQITKKPL